MVIIVQTDSCWQLDCSVLERTGHCHTQTLPALTHGKRYWWLPPLKKCGWNFPPQFGDFPATKLASLGCPSHLCRSRTHCSCLRMVQLIPLDCRTSSGTVGPVECFESCEDLRRQILDRNGHCDILWSFVDLFLFCNLFVGLVFISQL